MQGELSGDDTTMLSVHARPANCLSLGSNAGLLLLCHMSAAMWCCSLFVAGPHKQLKAQSMCVA